MFSVSQVSANTCIYEVFYWILITNIIILSNYIGIKSVIYVIKDMLYQAVISITHQYSKSD